MASKVFTPEQERFILENFPGHGPADMRQLLEDHFGVAFTANQVKGYYGREKLNSGTTGRYKPGHIPANKGTTGCAPGAEKGWFKAGSSPHNTLPVGTVQKKSDGYFWKKLYDIPKAGNKNWRQLHILLWEEAHGPVPPGHMVQFRDGDRSHCTLSNLILVSRRDNATLNKCGLRTCAPEFAETALLLAQIKHHTRKRRKNKNHEDF